MTLIVWPNIDFAPGDTGRRQWTKDLATAVLDVVQQLDDGVPFSDLSGVDLSSPPASGRVLLTYDPTTQTVGLGADVDPGGDYVATALLGAPDGVATLDGAGVNAQDPKTHLHNLRVSDNAGTIFTRPEVRFILPAGKVADNPGGLRTDVDLRTPDVRVVPLATTADLGPLSTANTNLVELTDWRINMGAPGNVDGYPSALDFEVTFRVQSDDTSDAKIEVQAIGAGADLAWDIDAEHASQTSADPTQSRRLTSLGEADGPQQFGGFATTGYSTARLRGSCRYPVGATTGYLRFRYGNGTAGGGIGVKALVFHSTLLYGVRA